MLLENRQFETTHLYLAPP